MRRTQTVIGAVGVVGVLCVVGCGGGKEAPPEAAIPTQAAERAFDEAAALCGAEGGRLWGLSLCGPMMFADPATHQAVLNETSPGAVRDASIYRLQLPASLGVANTSIELEGKRWTMVSWPLPDDATARAVLLMHESYHRIQPALGLVGAGGLGTNLHLDTREGRIWIRAELHTLASALRSQGDARRLSIADALLFRAYRRSLWPDAAAQERTLELNEGLAESTGIDAAISGADARVEAAEKDIALCEAAPSYVRSFPYATGAAYAELLDAARPEWRRTVTAEFDFGRATAEAYGVAVSGASTDTAEAALARYGGAEITAQEDARQKTVDDRAARFSRLFLDGPTVRFPLSHMHITFNPREVSSFGDHGSVYATVELSDDWGKLEVKSGAALISKDFKEVLLPAASAATVEYPEGKAWTVQLAAGYGYGPDPTRPGSLVVERGE